MINLNDYEPKSDIYGPGTRFVIWVQGCKLHCKGCWNKQMWSFQDEKLISPEDLAMLIFNTTGIEGITILGGEPMHQAEDLLKLAILVKQKGLSVFLYTGYELKELNDYEQIALVSMSDIVVSGRYIERLRNIELQWRGSSNQEVHFISSRYGEYQLNETNYCEIKLNKDGTITIMGYPNRELLDILIE